MKDMKEGVSFIKGEVNKVLQRSVCVSYLSYSYYIEQK